MPEGTDRPGTETSDTTMIVATGTATVAMAKFRELTVSWTVYGNLDE